mgnify:CR=1 FL=1
MKERAAQQGPVQVIDQVRFGSPADVVLRTVGSMSKVQTVSATRELIRRGVSAQPAMAAVDKMVKHGEVVLAVPLIESGSIFAADMRATEIFSRIIEAEME